MCILSGRRWKKESEVPAINDSCQSASGKWAEMKIILPLYHSSIRTIMNMMMAMHVPLDWTPRIVSEKGELSFSLESSISHVRSAKHSNVRFIWFLAGYQLFTSGFGKKMGEKSRRWKAHIPAHSVRKFFGCQKAGQTWDRLDCVRKWRTKWRRWNVAATNDLEFWSCSRHCYRCFMRREMIKFVLMSTW